MSTYTTAGISNITAGEYDLVMRPKYAPATPKRGILYVHGREGVNPSFAEFQRFIERATILSSIAGAGYTVVSADLGGITTWGNDTAIARITAAKNYLLTLGVLPTKIAMIGQSMGALNSLNWIAANPTLVSCFVGMIPVIDLNDIVTNNRGGYGAEASAAYAGGYTEATYGAAHNPATMAAAAKYATTPIQLWYGATDTIVIPTTVTNFAAAVGAGCSATSMTGGHAESTLAGVSIPSVLSFIGSNG